MIHTSKWSMMFLKLNFCSILQGFDTEQKSNSMSIHQMKKKSYNFRDWTEIISFSLIVV